MTGRAVFALGVTSLAFAFAGGACNALTGANDLDFDQASGPLDAASDGTPFRGDATSPPADAEPGDGQPPPSDAGADADSGCTGAMSQTIESATGTATLATNGTQVGTIPWTVLLVGQGGRAELTKTQVTNYLLTTHFGLDGMVPATAAIKGFEVSVTRSADFPGEVADYAVVLVKNGVPEPAAKTSAGTWPTSPVAASYGAANDLWAPLVPWTAADVRGTGFGVAIAARGADAAMTTARVTTVSVKVSFIRCPGP